MAGYAGFTEALDGDVTGHRTRALAADGAAALLWAGLAAFTATMNDRLPSGTFTGANDPATTTPALTGEDWGRRLLLRSYEARYALQSVLAAPGLTAPRARAAAEQLVESGRPAAAAALTLHATVADLAARHRNVVRRFTAGHPSIPVVEVASLAQDVHDVDGLREVGRRLADAG